MRYALAVCSHTSEIVNGERIYIFTGPAYKSDKTYTVRIPSQALSAYVGGALIQDAMPMLSKGDREFLMSGIHPEDWNRITKEE